ncbi:MAG: PfkB family carbohydrate kinase [Bacilli bacterium]
MGALAAAKKAKESGVLVSFDAGTVRDGVAELLPLADILITSEAFAREWTGESNLEKALKAFRIGARVTGCTMGENGSMVFSGGKFVKCPAV